MRDKTWSDVLGTQRTAMEIYTEYLMQHDLNESLAQWIERMSRELWDGDHDPNDDFETMAADLMEVSVIQAMAQIRASDTKGGH